MIKQQFRLSTVLSTELTSLFSSICYFTPLLGAYVADRYIGRFVLFIWIVHEHSFYVDIRMFNVNVMCPQRHNTRHIHMSHMVQIGYAYFIAHCVSETKVVNLYCLCSFKTILVFCAIYVVGMIACTVAAYPEWKGWTQPIFFIGMTHLIVQLHCDAPTARPECCIR